MLNFIFAGLANEIVRDVISGHEKETSHNPFLQPIEDEIERFEKIEKQARERLEALRQFHHWVSELFEPPKADNTETPKEPEKPQSPDPAAPEKPATPEVSDEAPPVPPQAKVEAEPSPRLKVLETGAKAAVKALKAAPMTARFRQINNIYELLLAALKETPGLTEMERVARFEAAIGEAVAFFQTSKLAKRFGVLKEVKKALEDTMNKRAQL